MSMLRSLDRAIPISKQTHANDEGPVGAPRIQMQMFLLKQL